MATCDRNGGSIIMALNKKRIVEQSLQLLNEDGLEGVTLRKLAKRLKVQPSALYWHVDNKEALINEMAEAILQTVFPTYLPQDENGRWQDGLIEVFRRLRKALLSYKDGGRVVAG